jgi:RNA polymerase sigma factor (sigma-70 family)
MRSRSSDAGGPPASELHAWVLEAQAGSRDALERVIAAVQSDVYGLALRFLWHPQDAEDASQEILVKIATRLSSFRADSSFRTWVYRVAVNTLLNIKRSRMEEARLTFTSFGADLDDRPSVESLATPPEAEHALLLEEIRVGCTLGMLLCLDRPRRMAYILGDILDLDHQEASAILEVTPAAYRQRLSRARRSIVEFMADKCGLVNPENRCRCSRRLPIAVARGRVDPKKLQHAGTGATARAFPETLRTIRSLEGARRAVALYQAQPEPRTPASLTEFVRTILDEPLGNAPARWKGH